MLSDGGVVLRLNQNIEQPLIDWFCCQPRGGLFESQSHLHQLAGQGFE